MNASGLTRIETLNKENYDTWKMQMEALLIKNDAWSYVNGDTVKPEPGENNANQRAVESWIKNDNKAKSDIILSISPSELKQVKGCLTSREVWLKLEGIYQSKGPARKATLLKQLTLQRMEDGGDVREHVSKFFDAVDKLNEMEVTINPDLLAIMLLYSLPPNFENFRCAIESRDELPNPETLRVKIIEESDARKNDAENTMQNAMMINRGAKYRSNLKKKYESSESEEKFKFKCHRCRKFGHKATDCWNKNKNPSQDAKNTEEDVSLRASEEFVVSNAALSASGRHDEPKWCLDSGATSHFCMKLQEFSEIQGAGNGKLNLANNESTKIKSRGTVVFSTNIAGRRSKIRLNNALHVPDLRTNLLSVGKITENNYDVIFRKNMAHVVDHNGKIKMIAEKINGLYFVREEQDHECRISSESSRKSSDTIMTWHRRLGHLNFKDLINAQRSGILEGLNFGQVEGKLECDICVQGKMTRTTFPKNSERKTDLLEIVHSDVCGPMRVESLNKAKYFVTFIDDSSKWCEVYFLRSKSEVLEKFKEFQKRAENQKERKVKCLQSDNGKEYVNKELDFYLKEHGIVRRLTVPHNPEQNGTSERKNRTLLEMAWCILMQSGLPPGFWAEAISTANYIRNRCPTKSLNGKTPYEAWTARKK